MWFYPPCLLTEFNICLVIIILLFSPVFLFVFMLLAVRMTFSFSGSFSYFFCVFLPVKNSLFLDNYLYLCRHY